MTGHDPLLLELGRHALDLWRPWARDLPPDDARLLLGPLVRVDTDPIRALVQVRDPAGNLETVLELTGTDVPAPLLRAAARAVDVGLRQFASARVAPGVCFAVVVDVTLQRAEIHTLSPEGALGPHVLTLASRPPAA